MSEQSRTKEERIAALQAARRRREIWRLETERAALQAKRLDQMVAAVTLRFDITHASVVQYLYTAVGRELICRSEILFAIEDATARCVEAIATQAGIRTFSELRRILSENKPTTLTSGQYRSFEEDALLYFGLREAPLADMYESLCRLETFMHAFIKTELERGYGPQDWWRKGIPSGVRKDCALAKEEDPEPQDDPYCYTTFIHLQNIFDKQWGIFCQLLPKRLASDKSKFLSELVRLNVFRNRIMHPVRGYRPTKHDLDFVKDFAARMFAKGSKPSELRHCTITWEIRPGPGNIT
jgi:hypothetical protein